MSAALCAPPVTTVLVVTESTLLREDLAASLVRFGAGVVHQASSVAQALALDSAGDIAVLDLGLPGGSGLSLVEALRRRGWQRVLVLASAQDPELVRAAFQAGADGVLLGGSTDHAERAWELSAREVEVLQHVADGLSNKEIGRRLGLSSRTVDTHLARIGRRLGTGDRALMVLLALRAGVIG
ncbi:DNA-binding NarL/FixJ family response regulator [Crossiella equi]|uniref:DNA-binding NarL/FixJ family response regulator n=1 Tax=Crossiella equi TaxID=130796 RepID=A0ABS5A672_9PSEU|nr:response regulator transcription factor [Crossiella equi]MBP2472096.1 DNA-binding NarL/FixJ family response regulator [Crossiella equi]